MTMRSLLALSILALTSIAPAAVVLTNFPGPADLNQGVKGNGGVTPTPQEYGFEFTVAGGNYDLITISFDISTHFGNVPLTVELYGSPSGPDAAVFLTALTGPPQPSNQIAVYAPSSPVILTDGGTYFVRLAVLGTASSYGLSRTATAATGVWGMGNYFTRPGHSGAWNAGGFAPETMMEIEANPVPEPAAAALSGTGLLLLLRRRR